jgi:hypothetical protein
LIYAFSPNLTLPRSYQWNVALEKSFSGRQVVSATYVGQAGRDLLRQEGLTSPNSSFVPGNFFFVTQNDASSNYNALQLQYRNQLESRLQLLVNYTWSHSLDDQSDDTDVAISDTVLSNRNDWASSSFDVRQSFSAALTYNVPSLGQSEPLRLLTKDWSLDTVVVARSGFPFNASVVTAGRIGASYPRPDVVPGQPFWISDSSIPINASRPLHFAEVPPHGAAEPTVSRGRVQPLQPSQLRKSLCLCWHWTVLPAVSIDAK